MKKLIALASASILALAFAAPVAAGIEVTPDLDAADCHGKLVSDGMTVTYVGKYFEFTILDLPGASEGMNPSQWADALGISVQEYQTFAKGLCSIG